MGKANVMEVKKSSIAYRKVINHKPNNLVESNFLKDLKITLNDGAEDFKLIGYIPLYHLKVLSKDEKVLFCTKVISDLIKIGYSEDEAFRTVWNEDAEDWFNLRNLQLSINLILQSSVDNELIKEYSIFD